MANKRIQKKRWKQAGGILLCAMCGRPLWPDRDNFITGRYGAVCHSCLQLGVHLESLDHTERSVEAPSNMRLPQELIRMLDRTVAGQEEAKRAIVVAVWKQQLRAAGEKDVPAGHLLLYGPSGCGKTMLAQQAASLVDLPCCLFDATTLSETGYRGRDAMDILKDYAAAAEGHKNRKWGMVILDEVDKLAARGGDARQAYCRGTQHSLLKLLEGATWEEIDSANLLFILCGAFHGLYDQEVSTPIGFLREQEEHSCIITPEDFVEFGMERELMGRVSGLAKIHPMTEDDLIHILLDKQNSIYETYRKFFAARGVVLKLSEKAARDIARRALLRGTGARALHAEMDQVMELLVMKLASGELKGEVEIDVRELRGLLQQAG